MIFDKYPRLNSFGTTNNKHNQNVQLEFPLALSRKH